MIPEFISAIRSYGGCSRFVDCRSIPLFSDTFLCNFFSGGNAPMGLTYVEGKAIGADGAEDTLRFLVDSGSQYSLLPKPTWSRLAVRPIKEILCTLADGTHIRRQVGDCQIEVLGERSTVRVVLGEEGDDEPLLGAVTLEHFGYVLDPFRRELRTMRVRL